MTGGWFAKPLEAIPRVQKEEPGDPDWYPLQHHFGLTAFGANAYVGREVGDELLGEHDETASGQEELYIVVAGTARFTLGRERIDAAAVTVVAIPDPAVVRAAVAGEPGTIMLAVGGERREGFRSSWDERHFATVPQVERRR